ncbi:MAG TPA: hypothetical protein ENK13_01980 [Thermopetrobacter sp.]|nr:hypothetical protein [Thermopetrobacter sp.]
MAEVNREEAALREALAEDALLLARLHGRELDAETLRELKAAPFETLFALLPEDEAAGQACHVIDAGWKALDDGDERTQLDRLAADYAATYLTHRHRVPVTESVCLDEDNLERQQPMMEVREWYRRFGVAAVDWRKQADDHIALQLAFIAHLLQATDEGEDGTHPAARLADVAAFMDAHVLKWIDAFAAAAASRCDTPFYAGLAMFTRCWLTALRAVCERLRPATGAPDASPRRMKSDAGGTEG